MHYYRHAPPSVALIIRLLLLLSTYFSSSLSRDCKPLAKTINVDQSGKGDSKTLQAAIDTIPENNDAWIKIHVRAGTYLEKVNITERKTCVILEGEGRETTIISWNDHVETSASATFKVRSENFVAKGISFVNSYNIQEEFLRNSSKVVGSVVPAIAALLLGDKQAFHQCSFVGYQDTVSDFSGRHYFDECYIEGAIDFIFGDGQSFYENCVINVTGNGYITAQGRSAANDTDGYVFESCHVVGSGPTFLGRAYGVYSRVIYHSCTIDVDISPEGWDAWQQKGNENNIYYVESNCTGAKYDTSKRPSWVKILDSSQVAEFTKDKFINQDGWINKQPN